MPQVQSLDDLIAKKAIEYTDLPPTVIPLVTSLS